MESHLQKGMYGKAAMTKFEEFEEVIARLRAPDGCPWDRAQTHISLKKPCIEEAAEVICGIKYSGADRGSRQSERRAGRPAHAGSIHAQIAEEEGLFTMDDVIQTVIDKMIRRHPHVFGEATVSDTGEVLTKWEDIKKQEKQGKEWADEYLPEAFEEAKELIEAAKERKGFNKRE